MIDATPPVPDGATASHARRLRWVAVALLAASVAGVIASQLVATGTGSP